MNYFNSFGASVTRNSIKIEATSGKKASKLFPHDSATLEIAVTAFSLMTDEPFLTFSIKRGKRDETYIGPTSVFEFSKKFDKAAQA